MSSSSGFVPPLSLLFEDECTEGPRAAGGEDSRVRELLGRWSRDEPLEERLGIVLEAGDLLRGCSAAVLPEVLIWLRDLRGHWDPQVRLAAGMAMARGVDAEQPGMALEVLNGAADLEIWREVPWVGAMPEELVEHLGGTSAAVVRWVADECDVGTRTELCVTLAGHSDEDRRAGAVQVAGKLVGCRRSPVVRLMPVLEEWTLDPGAVTRRYATHLLAALGGDASLLAERLHDSEPWVRDIAAWGLARQEDPRCLSHLGERLDAYGTATSYSTGTPYGYSTALPSLVEVLGRLEAHAPVLLPLIRERLRRPDDRMAPSLATVVGEWGEAAAEAEPELLGLLGTEAHLAAVKALARIGSAAAVPVLERMMRRPPGRPTEWESRWSRLVVAWAYWKLAGDPGPVLEELDAAFQGRYGQALWPYFEDLGPLAAVHAPRLRDLLERRDAYTRVGAASSLHRITGDAAEVFPTLWEVAYPLATGSFQPVRWEALRRIARSGMVPDRIRPVLAELAGTDRRLRCHGGWRAVDEDREHRELIAGMLA
ncbi:HEAT repeat domain-containing protein [Actinomadura sp. 9N407]|uniref:HEAT repeat domain-containing protein n=1 Tax=Actinomadura sp. 9N407 TaxID=3375154 RepID=UPI0037AA342E